MLKRYSILNDIELLQQYNPAMICREISHQVRFLQSNFHLYSNLSGLLRGVKEMETNFLCSDIFDISKFTTCKQN